MLIFRLEEQKGRVGNSWINRRSFDNVMCVRERLSRQNVFSEHRCIKKRIMTELAWRVNSCTYTRKLEIFTINQQLRNNFVGWLLIACVHPPLTLKNRERGWMRAG